MLLLYISASSRLGLSPNDTNKSNTEDSHLHNNVSSIISVYSAQCTRLLLFHLYECLSRRCFDNKFRFRNINVCAGTHVVRGVHDVLAHYRSRRTTNKQTKKTRSPTKRRQDLSKCWREHDKNRGNDNYMSEYEYPINLGIAYSTCAAHCSEWEEAGEEEKNMKWNKIEIHSCNV